jgi:hypothetical protein
MLTWLLCIPCVGIFVVIVTQVSFASVLVCNFLDVEINQDVFSFLLFTLSHFYNEQNHAH